MPSKPSHKKKTKPSPRNGHSSMENMDLPPSPLEVDLDNEDAGFHSAKLCICGNAGVGKTSMLLRYCNNSYVDGGDSTIGVEFKYNTVRARTGESIKLLIWDLAGQDRFVAVTQNYFRGANVILFVFDLGDDTSFKSIVRWLDRAGWTLKTETEFGGNDDYTIGYLIGNKSDLEGDAQQVPTDTATAFAKSMNLDYLEISCKENTNVRESLQAIADRLAQQNTEWVGAGKGSIFKNPKRKSLDADRSRSSNGEKTGCAC